MDIENKVEEFLKKTDGMYDAIEREIKQEEARREAERLAKKGEEEPGNIPIRPFVVGEVPIDPNAPEQMKPSARIFSDKEKIENDKSIELNARLDEARRFYILKNNVVKQNSSLFKKLSGFGKGPGLGEFQKELDDATLAYQKASKNYKDFLAKDMLDDAEDAAIIAKYFNHSEFLKIESTRTEMAIENRSWPEKAKGGYVKMIERYQKLPMKQKIAIGFALAGVGFATGAWAGAAAGAAVMTARRAFSMSVATVGYSNMFEAIADKNAEKNSNKNTENLVKSVDANLERSEFDAEEFRRLLDEKIENVDTEMNERDLKKKWRGYGAIGAGVATSLLGSYVGKLASPYISDAIKYWFGSNVVEHIKNAGHEAVSSAAKVMHGFMPSDVPIEGVENASSFGGGDKYVAPAGGVGKIPYNNPSFMAGHVEEMANKTGKFGAETLKQTKDMIKDHALDKLKIKPGGNIQASIRDFLREHPEALKMHKDKFGHQLNAGQVASRMWEEFKGDKLDLVHSGAQIHLSADMKHLVSVTGDNHMGHLPSHNVAENVAATHTPEHTNIVSHPVNHDSITDKVAAGHQDVATNHPTPATHSAWRPSENIVAKGYDNFASYNKVTEMPSAWIYGARYDIANMRLNIAGGNHGHWATIQNQPMGRVLADRHEIGFHRTFNHLMRSNEPGTFRMREFIKPKPTDTLNNWATRTAVIGNRMGVRMNNFGSYKH